MAHGQQDIDSYRFTSDSEPTDEQLEALMREVGEDVRRQRVEIKKHLQEKIREEYNRTYMIIR
jgi:hypothetical protein